MTREKIDRERVEELLDEGLDDEEVAEKLDCSKHTIQQIRLHELGRRRRGKGVNCIDLINILLKRPFIEENKLERKLTKNPRDCYKELVELGFPIGRKTLGKEVASDKNKERIYYIDRRFLFDRGEE